MQTTVKPTRTFPDSLLDQYRRQGDPPADAVIAAVTEAGGKDALSTLMRWLADTSTFDASTQPESVQRFFADYGVLPAWADPAQMARGMAFFQKQAGAIGLTLGLYSLPYCYLGADGARVLWMTERIKNDTARRLQETGEWVFAVNNPKQWQSGNAIRYTLKIRLIHAASRWFALHSGRWNMDWGHPINQEDMVGTNGAFSYIVIRGLRKLGAGASEADEEAYLHHINVVGYLNGVVEELLPQNLREAFHLDRVIARRQFAPSEAGVGLTKSLLNAVSEVVTRNSAGSRSESVRNLAAAQMRFFLGDTYADLLGIPAVPVEKQLVGIVNKLPIFPGFIPTKPSVASA
ncbi:hypothetical protein BN8_03312 [Fibrisoma limi BUZ 3]|uniref:ER-bound oxygenase mpaB/mpaB'/Rubber oxygenase catalytic domain-containing protein n=1 Tax=Fibrisoma limi BUZ 3 TaxID=1185876 RepID=I2GJU2_9BACT|nr:oxygenase MpaB family protein [Fibrisoma limi]CCH54167.1 hypothetical protein BN8_03312 [Fibrisoma limi BUZ 3]